MRTLQEAPVRPVSAVGDAYTFPRALDPFFCAYFRCPAIHISKEYHISHIIEQDYFYIEYTYRIMTERKLEDKRTHLIRESNDILPSSKYRIMTEIEFEDNKPI